MTSQKRKPQTEPLRHPGKPETRGERNCRWIEENCRVPEGRDVGKPAKLRDWQRVEICKIYDNPFGTRRAIISFGRKNGKTALAAWLLLLHLVGPESVPNSQLYSAAQARKQAAILFNLAAKTVRMSPTLRPFVVIRDTAKELVCPLRGTIYTALSAEASTAYGLSPVFTVHDELGQVKGPRSELYEALETATGAQEAPLSIIISTQAPTDADLLSVLIDDAAKGADKRVTLSLYTADPNADPFVEGTIRQANPAYGDFQNAAEVLSMAEDARRMPSREAEYRNLVLNQRVTVSSPFVSLSVWAENATAPAPIRGKVYGGLDLSEVSDLTAAVFVEPTPDLWSVSPMFWLPEVGLVERSRSDRVPYDLWARDGFLKTTPGRSVEYQFVAFELRRFCDAHDVGKINFDRWNWKHFRPWLVQVYAADQLPADLQQYAGVQLFADEYVDETFAEFGQGFASMSPALRDTESLLLAKKLAHGDHPVLKMCAGNAVVKSDEAGNKKLTKAKSFGRIDGMVSLVMAIAAASTYEAEKPPESPWNDPSFSIASAKR